MRAALARLLQRGTTRTLALMPNAGLDPYACDCGWLAKAADEPAVPISFDAQTNEYYIEMRGSGQLKGRMFISFLPKLWW